MCSTGSKVGGLVSRATQRAQAAQPTQPQPMAPSAPAATPKRRSAYGMAAQNRGPIR